MPLPLMIDVILISNFNLSLTDKSQFITIKNAKNQIFDMTWPFREAISFAHRRTFLENAKKLWTNGRICGKLSMYILRSNDRKGMIL